MDTSLQEAYIACFVQYTQGLAERESYLQECLYFLSTVYEMPNEVFSMLQECMGNAMLGSQEVIAAIHLLRQDAEESHLLFFVGLIYWCFDMESAHEDHKEDLYALTTGLGLGTGLAGPTIWGEAERAAFKVLNLSPTLNRDAVRTAHRKLIRQVHPDIVQGAGLDETCLAASVAYSKQLNLARETVDIYLDALALELSGRRS